MKARQVTWLRTFRSASAAFTAAAGAPAGPSAPRSRWNGVARGAVRFGAVYSGLYCLTTPQFYLALRGGGMGRLQEAADSWANLWEIRPLRNWVSVRLLGRELGARFDGGDDPYTWAGELCWLAVAAGITPVWARLRPAGKDGFTAEKWARLAARFCLAGQMFSYGAAKAIPLQFQLPPSKLVEPLGNLSPMGMLWAQTGSSQTYQVLLGCAEIVSGLLLIAPRTATLGALLAAAEMTQVFVLNVTFDVPVKVHSFHLILLSLLLLAPESRRLAAAVLTQRGIPSAPRPDLFRSRSVNRAVTALQVGAGLWLLGSQLRNDWAVWKNHGGGRAKPELHGVWDVVAFFVDGESRPPLATDAHRWRRLVVDSADVVSIQYMDDSLDPCLAAIDMRTGSMTLTKMADPAWRVALALRCAEDTLTLEGDDEGKHLNLILRRRVHTTFPLVNRDVHWVQENSSLR